MLIGYARTSTIDQTYGLEAQLELLNAQGVKTENVYHEKISSVGDRVELKAAIKSLRKGDKLVVTKLDRLARSVTHMGNIIQEIQGRDADLVILDMGIDTSTATGKLMLNVLGSVAQFEREVMLERQREGIERARREGKYKGRKPTALAQKDKVLALKAAGVPMDKIMEQANISRASYYRLVK